MVTSLRAALAFRDLEAGPLVVHTTHEINGRDAEDLAAPVTLTLPARGPGRMHLVAGRADTLPAEDGCADAVVLASGRDRLAAAVFLAEAMRVRAPGGRVVKVASLAHRDLPPESCLSVAEERDLVAGRLAVVASERFQVFEPDTPLSKWRVEAHAWAAV